MTNAARRRFDEVTGAEGRTASHILTGLAVTTGAVLVSALIARANAPTPDNPAVYSDYEELVQPGFKPPAPVFAWVWPPLFVALAISGLRVWNAPPSRARSQALGLWGAIQGLNALWMALGPRRLGGQLTTAVASLGAAVAYVLRARSVDGPAAGLTAPYLGWIGFANVLTEELWRKNRPSPTIH